jgi:hypothetical protein
MCIYILVFMHVERVLFDYYRVGGCWLEGKGGDASYHVGEAVGS